MTLRPLEAEDRKWVEDLLRGNPYKEDQIRFQGLDRDRVVRFHCERLFRRIDDPEKPVLVYESLGNRALFGYAFAQHHSAFFGKRIFSMDLVITYDLVGRQKSEALLELGSLMLKEDPEVIWSRCDECEGDLVDALIQSGGSYCGTSLRMSKWLGEDNPVTGHSGFTIREATVGDLSAVRSVAKSSHHHSHFFRDPNLPETKRAEIFPHYVERCLGHPNRPVLLAVEPKGSVLGFSLLLMPENQEKNLGRRIGIIDFIAVTGEAQGKGVGRSLLEVSHAHLKKAGYEVVELKTMLDNRQAIRFYQKDGFRILSAEMYFSIGKKAF